MTRVDCASLAVRGGYVLVSFDRSLEGTRQIGQGQFPPDPRMRAMTHLFKYINN